MIDNTHRDLLFDCFERLLDTVQPSEPPDQFVHRVAEDYLLALVREAHVPLKYIESLRQDICSEVHDMLKIKTYGYLSLSDFLEQRQNPKKIRQN